MEQVALSVAGLDCPESERAVTSALISEPGVCWATAASNPGLVSVQYDPERTDLEALLEAIEGSGCAPSARLPE